MIKNILRGIAVLLIVWFVFTVVALLLPFPKNWVFLLAYLFGVIAIITEGHALGSGFIVGERKKSKLYGFPIARLGTIYLVLQLILSFVCIIFSEVIPFKLALGVFVVLFAAAAVGLITASAIRGEIVSQDKKLQKDVKTIRALQSKVRSIVGICEDSEVKAAVGRLSDALQYSDPVSNKELESIESDLMSMANDIEKAVLVNESDTAKLLCKQATAALNERNRLCKLYKK